MLVINDQENDNRYAEFILALGKSFIHVLCDKANYKSIIDQEVMSLISEIDEMFYGIKLFSPNNLLERDPIPYEQLCLISYKIQFLKAYILAYWTELAITPERKEFYRMILKRIV